MRQARAGQTVLAVLTVLLAVLLGAHLLAPGAGVATEARAGSVGQGQGSSYHESGSDVVAGQLRHRTRQRVGKLLEPETQPPVGGAAAFTGADAFDECHSGYRTASRYGARVPPRDTSPAALQVFRC